MLEQSLFLFLAVLLQNIMSTLTRTKRSQHSNQNQNLKSELHYIYQN